MSVFTDAEIEYLQSQRLGRLATVGPDNRPHVVPVSLHYNAHTDTIDVGGHGFGKSKKWRDVQKNRWVSIVVDDVTSQNKLRGIEIRGEAELSDTGKTIRPGFDDEMFRIRPQRIISWGIETDSFSTYARSVE